MAKRTEITPDQVRARLDSCIADMDRQRTGGLEKLLVVRQARARALERAAEKQASKGARGEAKAASLERKLTLNRRSIEALRPIASLARQEPPRPKADTWTLKGLVLSEANEGVEGVSVVLVDANGTKIRGLPTTTTRADGSYEIEVPAKERLPGEVFVQARVGNRKTLLVERSLAVEPGSMELVIGRTAKIGRPPVRPPIRKGGRK